MPLKDPVLRREYQLEWQRKMRANLTPDKKEERKQKAYERRTTQLEDPAFRREYRTKAKSRMRKFLYGLTTEMFEELIASQNNLCALCHEPFQREARCAKYPAIDHDHITGKVRAVIHANCNIALGLLYDSPEKCRQAALYLEKHREEISNG
jgi:hypothetical protein